MITTVPTKDVGDVRDKRMPSCGKTWQLEDGIERWVKRDLGVVAG